MLVWLITHQGLPLLNICPLTTWNRRQPVWLTTSEEVGGARPPRTAASALPAA